MDNQNTAKNLRPGDHHYRAFVGPPERYDILAANQFNLMTFLGLREHHTLLDIGCGSLRAGRLFIPYLKPGNYYGVEPEKWLVEEGIKHECGQDLIELKRPTFLYVSDYSFVQLNTHFDFLLAQSIFSHAPEADVRKCLVNAQQCIHSDSIFAATIAVGKKDYQGTTWVYPGKVTYTPNKILEMASEADLVCEQTKWFHPSMTWYLFSKPENIVSLTRYKERIDHFYSSSLLIEPNT